MRGGSCCRIRRTANLPISVPFVPGCCRGMMCSPAMPTFNQTPVNSSSNMPETTLPFAPASKKLHTREETKRSWEGRLGFCACDPISIFDRLSPSHSGNSSERSANLARSEEVNLPNGVSTLMNQGSMNEKKARKQREEQSSRRKPKMAPVPQTRP